MSNTVIQLKYSTTTGTTPASLANGELAINSYDGKLFYSDPSGLIKTIQGYTGPAGLNGEIQFNDSGTLGASANLTLNKSTGNLSAQSLYTRSYIQFTDGTKQYTANAGTGGGGGGYSAAIDRRTYTATAGQTLFNINYVSPYVLVIINGVTVDPTEYTATTNTNITLVTAAKANDTVDLIGFSGNTILNAIDQTARNIANTANATAQAAFDKANTGGGSGTDQYARNTANAAFNTANAAFNTANTDVTNLSISDGTFGSASIVPVVKVEANGRISSISNSTISIDATQIGSGTLASARISGSYTGITGVGTLTNGTWTANSITTAYTDAKITSVGDQTGAISNTQLLDFLLQVDGSGSGLDADLLDGFNSTSFANATFAQDAYDKANTANLTAQAAFDKANTGGTGTDQYARNTANAAFNTANAAFAKANTGGSGGAPAAIDRQKYIATEGQTTFNINYTSPYVLVVINGIVVDSSEYTATSNTFIVLSNSSQANDIVDLIGFSGNTTIPTAVDQTARNLAQDAYDKANTDATNVSISSGTYGSISIVPVFRAEANGRISSISNATISIDTSQIGSGTLESARVSGQYTGITGVGTLTNGTWTANSITTAYTDAKIISVGGQTGAISNNQLLDFIKAVDGIGTGLDADLLDGFNSTSFANATFAQGAYDKANTGYSSNGGTISGDVTITGNLTVDGNVVTVSANNLSVQDNMIYLNQSLSRNTYPDLGIVGAYSNGTYQHTGIFRDQTDGIWKFFDGYLPEPDLSVYIDTSNTSFRLAPLSVAGFTASQSNVGTVLSGTWNGTSITTAYTDAKIISVGGQTGAISNTQLLNFLLQVDGSGSGLDADLLDGKDSTSFANATFAQGAYDKANTASVRTINFIIDGGGSVITTGSKGNVFCDFTGTISGWTILGDDSGTITVDISKATYTNFPTFTASGGTSPALSAAQKNQSFSINWTGFTTISANDVLQFAVSGTPATVKLVTVALKVIS